MPQSQSIALSLLPLMALILVIYMLWDWYYHARRNQVLWLVAILFLGVIGYAFFYFSGDREE